MPGARFFEVAEANKAEKPGTQESPGTLASRMPGGSMKESRSAGKVHYRTNPRAQRMMNEYYREQWTKGSREALHKLNAKEQAIHGRLRDLVEFFQTGEGLTDQDRVRIVEDWGFNTEFLWIIACDRFGAFMPEDFVEAHFPYIISRTQYRSVQEQEDILNSCLGSMAAYACAWAGQDEWATNEDRLHWAEGWVKGYKVLALNALDRYKAVPAPAIRQALANY